MEAHHYNPYGYYGSTELEDAEMARLVDSFQGVSYGTPEVRTTMSKGSGRILRAGSKGYAVVRTWMSLYGPGLVVMLAATDAGSLITCAQLGKVWGYAMLLWQVLLTYPLFETQELTVRLGASTKLGHAELLKQEYGPVVAWACSLVVVATCIGTIVAQMKVLAGIAEAFGASPVVSCGVLVLCFAGLVLGGYADRLEKVGLALGLCQLVFFASAVASQPSLTAIAEGVLHSANFSDPSFAYLLAANIGSVLSPWMVYYEQSAVVDKAMHVAEVPAGRKDTMLGACLCQGISTAVIMAAAARSWNGVYGDGVEENGFDSILVVFDTLLPFKNTVGRVCILAGFVGAALNAMLVVNVTAVCVIAEVSGLKNKDHKTFLQHTPMEQPFFYALFVCTLALAMFLTLSPYAVSLITVSLTVNILNTFLLPISFLFLVQLCSSPHLLEPPLLLQGREKLRYYCIFAVILLATVASIFLSF